MNTKRGGKRENSGRKPIQDKKKQVCFYLNSEEVEKIGGVKKLKEKVGLIVNQDLKFSIDFFELSFLAEACIPPVPIARSMFWEKMINHFYGILKKSERKSIFEWMSRNDRYLRSLETEEDVKLFHSRYNPDNQYLITAKYDENELQVEAFLHNDRYYTSKNVSIAEEYITKIEKINETES